MKEAPPGAALQPPERAVFPGQGTKLPHMAVTVTEKRLPIGGEWIETGEWIEVRSPYSGEVVGRAPKGGAAETRRAIDAAEAAMRDPLPAHKRAEVLVRVAGRWIQIHAHAPQLGSLRCDRPREAPRRRLRERKRRPADSLSTPRHHP